MYKLLNVSEEEYNSFIEEQEYTDFSQLTSWGKLKEINGWTWDYIAVGDDCIRAGALLLFKKIPKLKKTICYIPRGPILDWTDKDLFTALFSEILKVAKKRNSIMIKLDPDVEEDNEGVFKLLNEKGFLHKGFVDGLSAGIQARFHMLTPLDRDMDTISSNFSSRNKTKVRKSLKNPLSFEDAGLDKLEIFHKLMEETGLRDGFRIRNLDYFKKMFELMRPGDNCRLFLISLDLKAAFDLLEKEIKGVERDIERFKNKGDKYLSHIEGLEKSLHDKKLLAESLKERLELEDRLYLSGNFYVQIGKKAYYLYGASSDQFREFLPNYFMQYKSMEFAKNHGALSYDWGGITGREGKENDEAPGLYDFKKQWASYKRARIGEFDYVLSPFWYRLYNLALKILER